MEIPAWWFLSFSALISITFLHLGFYALDKTHLSNSVPPIVMSLFKHSLAVSCCHSSSYALIFRPRSKLMIEFRYLWVLYGGLPVLVFSSTNGIITWGCLLWATIKFSAWLFRFPELSFFADRFSLLLVHTFFDSDFFPWMCFPLSAFINFFLVPFGGYYLTREQVAGIRIHMAVESSLYLIRGNNTKFFPVLVLLISLFTSAFWAALFGLDPLSCASGDPLSGDVRFQNLLSLAGKRLTETFRVSKEKKTWKFIEFAVGIVGTVLFQSFFRVTSFSQVEAFLYLAVVWVANLALLGVSCDFGVFNFLLGNVIVGCTVSEFGLLGGATWLACGAALLLFGLRLKLESLRFLDGGGEHAAGVSLRFVDRGGELAGVISPIVDRRGDEVKVILW